MELRSCQAYPQICDRSGCLYKTYLSQVMSNLGIPSVPTSGREAYFIGLSTCGHQQSIKIKVCHINVQKWIAIIALDFHNEVFMHRKSAAPPFNFHSQYKQKQTGHHNQLLILYMMSNDMWALAKYRSVSYKCPKITGYYYALDFQNVTVYVEKISSPIILSK